MSNPNSGNNVARNITVKEDLILGGDIRSRGKRVNINIWNNVDIQGDLEIEGSLKKLGNEVPTDGQVLKWNQAATEWLPGDPEDLRDAGDIWDTRITKVFTGTMLNNGDVATHDLYSQVNHSRSVVEFKILVHDINSNTFYRYLGGTYMWVREWTNDATRVLLGELVNSGSGDPYHFDVDIIAEENTIKARIIHNTIETNVCYKIIAKIMQT